jgi:hypothetical protein
MKDRGVFDLTWSKSSVRLLGALAVGLVFQSALADDPTAHKAHPSVPTSVLAKLPGSVKSHLSGAASKIDQSRSKLIQTRLAEQHHAFVENKGQWNSEARYRAESEGMEAWLTKAGITFNFYKPSVKNGHRGYLGQVVKMEFQGTNGSSSAVGINALPNSEEFLTKKASHPQVASRYRGVLSKDLYAGVDLKTYYSGTNVRYDLIVHPGAKPETIKFGFKGADSVQAVGQKLVLGTQLGKIAQGQLFAYQMTNGHKVGVPASFQVESGKVSFRLGQYDRSKDLVIDPVIYGTYFGGNAGYDEVHSIVSDTLGGVYVTGTTQSTDFPITAGPYFITLFGTQNGFMSRFQGDAYNVDYSVLFGGSNIDNPEFIQIDPYGNIWIAGTTTSPDFPGNTKGSGPSNPDIFVIRFQKSASKILDPTTNPAILMIGGTGSEMLQGFAVVPIPNAPASGPTSFLVAGNPDQTVPEVPGSFNAQKGFLLSYSYQDGGESAGFTQNSSQSFYIGDNTNFPVTISGLATDASGAAYITGAVGISGQNVDTVANPNTFTTTAGVLASGATLANSRIIEGVDLFVRKYSSAGTLIFSGLVGGSDDEVPGGQDINPDGSTYVSGSCIAVDSQGALYILGSTNSTDYPRSRGSFGEGSYDGFQHMVVTKISADGSQILYSSNLRDADNFGDVFPSGIAVDGYGQAFVTGNLFPPNLTFPGGANPDSPNGYVGGATPPSVQLATDGADAPISTTWTYPNIPQITGMGCFLNVLNPTGTNLVYGTYLAGTLDTKVFGPYIDAYSDLWVYGWTAGVRTYTVFGTTSASPIPPYLDFSSLPAGLITSKAYKSVDVADKPLLLNWAFWDPFDIVNPGVLPIFESRDGWLAKIRLGRPVVQAVNLGQTIVPGGLGYQTTATVVLSGPAPAQGAQVVLTLDNASAASFANSGSLGTVTLQIPAGQTTSSAVPIFSLPVITPTPVNVKATYDGNFLISALNVVPWLQNLTLNPTAVVGGNNVTGTITLAFPAPSGGVPVTVTSSSTNLTFPTNNLVTVPAGQSTVTFTIGTVGVDSITSVGATATVLGVTKTAALELDPASLLSITVLPTSVSALGTISGTVTLTGLPGGLFPAVTVTVTDTLGNPLGTYMVNPTPLSFNGSNTATFTIQTPYEASQIGRLAVASMSAVSGTGYGAQSISAVFTVDPSALLSLSVDKLTPNPGDTVNATITLAAAADQGGALVTLSSSNPAVLPIPAAVNPVTIPAGATTTSPAIALPITSVATLVATPVTLTATRGSVTSSVTINVQPATATFLIADGNGNPVTAILGGNNLTGTVSISAPAPEGGFTVTLNSNPAGLGTIANNATVTIPAGQTSATFTIAVGQVSAPTTLTLSTLVGGEGGLASNTQQITVNPAGLQSIIFIPASVRSNHTTLCKVILTGPAPAGGLSITLTPSNSKLFGNIEITVPAGKTVGTASVFAKRVSRPLAVTWTAQDSLSNIASAVLVVLR